MITTQNINSKGPVWYFLSKQEYNEYKFDKFIDNGYWEYYEGDVKTENDRNSYRQYLREIQIGDKVAIYNLYHQTRDDFEKTHNYQIPKQTKVTYILIRAIGKISHPCKDNKTVYF